MTDQEKEEFEFRLRLEKEDEANKSAGEKAGDWVQEMTGVEPSSPAFGGAVGAIAGIPAGRIISGATKSAMAPLPTPATGTGTGGEKWARNWAGMNKPGTTVPEAAAAYQRTKGHGSVSAEVSKRFGPNAKLDINSYKAAQAARPLSERIGSSLPEGVRRTGQAVSGAASSIPAWVGRGLAGASAGFQGVDAANRYKSGDYLGSAISGLGSLGSAASLVPHPLVRGVGTAVGIAAPFANEAIDAYKKRNQPPVPQYAGGKLVEKAIKKTPSGLETIKSMFSAAPEQTVEGAQRMAFPGIYKRPDVIAAEAAARVASEDPALKRLFGVTREDLYQMGKGRVGNLPGTLPGAAAKPKGSSAALGVMTPRNEQRLLDVMSEAEKHHSLVQGMDPWYIMDPAYNRMVELMGPERAAQEYKRLNTLMGMASPGSEVLVEIPRGTAANYLNKQGRFSDFMEHGGARSAQRPEDFATMPGHMYHKTSQAVPMQRYLERGEIDMTSPKVPMYIEASGVPATGFQTATPVGDAHWSRAVGLADTRGAKTIKGKPAIPGASVTNPEMTQLAPWWRDRIAGELGIESVPAQARAWGAFAPQTGVESPIGSPKLEMFASKIMETAERLGVSPETARDMVLRGENWAGKKEGGLASVKCQ